MRRIQLNTTISKKDLDFVTDNLGKMTKSEMALRLNVSRGKLYENCRIAGIKFPSKNRHGFTKETPIKKAESEFFTGNEYSGWIV